MSKSKTIAFGLAAAAMLMASGAAADEIVLDNGDVITGKVSSMDKGVLTIKPPYAEAVKVKKGSIRSMRTDEAVDIRTVDGQMITAQVLSLEAGKALLATSGGKGRLSLGWGEIDSINQAPSRLAGAVTVGASLRSGNTDRSALNAGVEAEHRTLWDRTGLRFLYNYAEENGKTTTRNAYASVKYDYFFTKAYYGYLSAEMLHDRFKDLTLRTVAGPGVGYQVWEEASRSLLIELGLSLVKEDLRQGEDDSWVTARAGSSLTLRLARDLTFSDSVKAYLRTDDTGNYQLRNEASIKTALGDRWGLRLTNIIEHNSKPPVGIEKTDIQWLLALQYSF